MVAGVGVAVARILFKLEADAAVTSEPFSGLALDRDCERCFFKSANVPAFNSSNPFSLFLSKVLQVLFF